MGNEAHIAVNDRIQLSEIRPGVSPAFVEPLNDKEICRNTLQVGFHRASVPSP